MPKTSSQLRQESEWARAAETYPEWAPQLVAVQRLNEFRWGQKHVILPAAPLARLPGVPKFRNSFLGTQLTDYINPA
jgi:hypothetical protein